MWKRITALAVLAVCAALPAGAAERLKPFILAQTSSGDPAAMVAAAEAKLAGAGFEIVGRYSPYPEATILVVTDAALQRAAAASEFGGYGAAQRVAVTQVGDEVQLSYTSPRYMAAAYRMAADLAPVERRLAEALGAKAAFGPDEGLTEEELREYHYMFGMEYFDDPDQLARYDSYEEAVAAVEQGLAEGRMGVTKVYRIDIPGKEETVFGVAMDGSKGGGDDQDDAYIMSEIDFKPVRSTAHLPYEILVSGGRVYALSARFRIAINFPDLSMMGANSFMNIMGAPEAIRTALAAVAGRKVKARTGQVLNTD